MALDQFFARQHDWPSLTFQLIPAADVLLPDQLESFAKTLFETLKEHLQRRVNVHLLLAGGRKPMAMIGMSIAQLLFGPSDRVWYLHSDDSLRQSGRMELLPNDSARLIPVPLPQRGAAQPFYTATFAAATPDDALRALAADRRQALAHFVTQELTPAERAVAQLVATDVMTLKQIAERLHKSPKTVSNQLNSIYSKLEAAFALRPDRSVKREFLRRELAEFFEI